MRVIPNSELEAQERQEADRQAVAFQEAESGVSSMANTTISAYIRTCFDDAKRFKEMGVEPEILANMRQIDAQYDPSKLAAIREMGGSEVFMAITGAKCKNADFWVQDILFQPNQRPWGIEPTPIPELPEAVMQEIAEELFNNIVEQIAQTSMAMGTQPDMNYIQQQIEQNADAIKKAVREEIINRAREKGRDAEQVIDDKLIEGGWYDSLRRTIPNIVMHTGFLKGPVTKMRKVLKIAPDQTGKMSSNVVEEPYPTWESRHPLYIYPAPGSTDINDGYLIDRVKITPLALQQLLGVPGYSDLEIIGALEDMRGGKLSEWLPVDQEFADIKGEQSQMSYDSDKMDMLEFWGALDGEKLTEWGLQVDLNNNPLESEMFYPVKAYLIGNHVIGAMLNDDPLGRKPFYKTSFENIDGSFWGKGLPQVISDCQQICNAMARAIVNSSAMASGPQVERNIDRIPVYARQDNKLTPWKVWDVTSDMMSTGPALNFYQPPMVVERLMSVYTNFSKIADEHSSIPAYAHGDSQVGGAGNTASGLSMLMGAAARGIRGLVSSIDLNMTKPSVERQYLYVINESAMEGLICDYQIVTAGTSAALVREQLAARRLEFMAQTANPIDIQILGPEGRKYLLEETARSIQLDLRKVFPPGQSAPAQLPPGGAAPGQGARQLNEAGAPVVGQDERQFNQGPPIEGRAEGGPVAPGQPYVVGEQGPEVMVPSQPGTIIPNQQTPQEKRLDEDRNIDADMERSHLQKLLLRNQDKNFVRRILTPDKYPILSRPDIAEQPGSYSTHLMAFSELPGGGVFVYPEIVHNEQTNKLTRLPSKDAARMALQTGEYLTFDTPAQAEWFVKNYKKAMPRKTRGK